MIAKLGLACVAWDYLTSMFKLPATYVAYTLIVLTLSSTATFSQGRKNEWVCVADRSVGLKFDIKTKSWFGTTMNTDGERYIVRPARPSDLPLERGIWSFQRLGDQSGFMCSGDFNEFGILRCDAVGSELSFNKEALRFQLYYRIGFVDPGAEVGNTPSISIGYCSLL
jgi:hypothetical protein